MDFKKEMTAENIGGTQQGTSNMPVDAQSVMKAIHWVICS